MRWGGSPRKTARRAIHRSQDARPTLRVQNDGELAPRRDDPDEGTGPVGVALVAEDEPGGLGIGVDGRDDVRREVGVGASRPERGGQDRTGGDVEIGDQVAGVMADLLALAALAVAGAR